MNLTVNSQRLAAELRLLNKVVPTKPTVAILSHALLRADGDLRLYATDLEVAVEISCDASVSMPGSTAVPVARLLQMVEQFPDADVLIEANSKHVVVRCNEFTSRLQAMPVDDFPEPAAPSGGASVIDAAGMRSLIAKTSYAVAQASTKYVLKGALLTLAGPVAAMVATDGIRLALATANRQDGLDSVAIVPGKALDVLAGQTDDGDVEMTVGERHLFFKTNGFMLTSRKLEGTFPKYQNIVPRNNDRIAEFDRNELTAALRRVVLVAEESGAVYFGFEGALLSLSSASVGVGSAHESVPVRYDGPPMKACLGGKFVLDFLNAASGASVKMALKDERTAVLLTDGDDNVGVIMVMRNN